MNVVEERRRPRRVYKEKDSSSETVVKTEVFSDKVKIQD